MKKKRYQKLVQKIKVLNTMKKNYIKNLSKKFKYWTQWRKNDIKNLSKKLKYWTQWRKTISKTCPKNLTTEHNEEKVYQNSLRKEGLDQLWIQNMSFFLNYSPFCILRCKFGPIYTLGEHRPYRHRADFF